jgi:hypothetical protein
LARSAERPGAVEGKIRLDERVDLVGTLEQARAGRPEVIGGGVIVASGGGFLSRQIRLRPRRVLSFLLRHEFDLLG